MYLYVYICVYACMYVHIYVGMCMCVHMCVHVYVCMCMHVRVCMYMYIHCPPPFSSLYVLLCLSGLPTCYIICTHGFHVVICLSPSLISLFTPHPTPTFLSLRVSLRTTFIAYLYICMSTISLTLIQMYSVYLSLDASTLMYAYTCTCAWTYIHSSFLYACIYILCAYIHLLSPPTPLSSSHYIFSSIVLHVPPFLFLSHSFVHFSSLLRYICFCHTSPLLSTSHLHPPSPTHTLSLTICPSPMLGYLHARTRSCGIYCFSLLSLCKTVHMRTFYRTYA